jgi:di/tricarboxylate transporter
VQDDEEQKARARPDIVLAELALLPRSPLAGRSASDALLRTRFGVNLLAVSRQGRRSTARLRSMPLAGGDVLLMQGPPRRSRSLPRPWSACRWRSASCGCRTVARQ